MSKTQFCWRKLKFYKVSKEEDSGRDYSVHDDRLETLVENELRTGHRKREDVEIRFIKFMIGRSENSKTGDITFSPPSYKQELLREFPLLLKSVHEIHDKEGQGTLEQITEIVLSEFFNSTTKSLIELNDENYSKLVVKLTEIFQSLEWRKVRIDVKTTKEDRLTNFLARDIRDLLGMPKAQLSLFEEVKEDEE
jgi:hypothetical protein